jgi:hypothetical protein
MSNRALELLEEAIDQYSRLHPIGNRVSREAAFHPVQCRIDNIRQIVALDRYDLFQYLDSLRTHWLGALATRTTLGNSPEKHRIWAESAIRVLKRNLNQLEDWLED